MTCSKDYCSMLSQGVAGGRRDQNAEVEHGSTSATGVTAADLTRRQTLPGWRILAPPCGGAAHPVDVVTGLAAEYLTRRETLPALILTGVDAR